MVALAARDDWERSLAGVAHGFTHTWEHCHALALTTGFDTYLWCLEDGPDRWICPFVERPFDQFSDIATPPGISGFAGGGECNRLLDGWRRFARRHGYVAGYIGLHPLFAPAACRATATPYNSIYVLDLRQTTDCLLQRMDRNRRRELRAYEALSGRLTTDRPRLTRFILEEYDTFAERVSMRPSERWSAATLEAYCAATQALVIGVEGSNGVEAAHVYGYTPYAAEFMLQIARATGRTYTTALIWHAVTLFRELGVPALNLGGGMRENDPIARAKRRFGCDRYELSALREVYDIRAYEELCRRTGVHPETPGYFPAYRRPALEEPS